jgi:hypothetical protein
MPTINPLMYVQAQFKKLMALPSFQTLSPTSQRAIAQAAQTGQVQNAAVSSAIHEAVDKNLLPKFTATTLLEEAGIIGGAAAGGLALGNALSSAGAVAPITAAPGIGETAATTGLAGPIGSLPVYDAAGSVIAPAASTAVPAGMAVSPIDGSLVSAPSGLNTAVGPTLAQAGLSAPPGVSTASSIWKDLLPSIIGGGAAVGGAAIQAGAQTKAAEIQAQTQAAALAQAKAIYEQQRADEAPYRGLGAGAVGNLQYLSGITPPPSATTGATDTPSSGYFTQGGVYMPARTQPSGTPSEGTAVPRSGSTLADVGTEPTTVVVGSDGTPRRIPTRQLPQAVQAGYRQVQ